jgi:phage/plasmid-associated DNA primase
VTLWHNLMKHMFNSKPPFTRQWFEKWIAYPLQCLGTKLHTALVVYGTCQGSGKSIRGDIIRGVYGDNAVEIEKSSLSSNFNSYIAKR